MPHGLSNWFEKGIRIFLSFLSFFFLNAIYQNFSKSNPELGWMVKSGERKKKSVGKEAMRGHEQLGSASVEQVGYLSDMKDWDENWRQRSGRLCSQTEKEESGRNTTREENFGGRATGLACGNSTK